VDGLHWISEKLERYFFRLINTRSVVTLSLGKANSQGKGRLG